MTALTKIVNAKWIMKRVGAKRHGTSRHDGICVFVVQIWVVVKSMTMHSKKLKLARMARVDPGFDLVSARENPTGRRDPENRGLYHHFPRPASDWLSGLRILPGILRESQIYVLVIAPSKREVPIYAPSDARLYVQDILILVKFSCPEASHSRLSSLSRRGEQGPRLSPPP